MLDSYYGIVLCRSKTNLNQSFFHYIMANKDNIKQMHRDYIDNKLVDFSVYGSIVLSGWGENPSTEYEAIINQIFKQSQPFLSIPYRHNI